MLHEFDSTILGGLPVTVIARVERGTRGWSSARSIPPDPSEAEVVEICWMPRRRSRRTLRPVSKAVFERIPDSDFDRLEGEALGQVYGV